MLQIFVFLAICSWLPSHSVYYKIISYLFIYFALFYGMILMYSLCSELIHIIEIRGIVKLCALIGLDGCGGGGDIYICCRKW